MTALPEPGRCTPLAPGLRIVRAADASAMRGPGTNSYLLGTGTVTLIDPGPDDPAHLRAILSGLGGGERITRIIVTHRHHDHSGNAAAARAATGAPVLAFAAPAPPAIPAWARAAHPGGGEGVDHAFTPDATLSDGAPLEAGGIAARVIHTPGHLDDHICIAWDGGLLTADHVMGWSTTLVSPPEGCMAAYMASLRRLLPLANRPFFPAHGAPIANPHARLTELIAHRQGREAAILAALTAPAPLDGIIARVYPDLAPHLHPAAARNVLAHLIDLAARGLVRPANGQFCAVAPDTPPGHSVP